MAAQAWLFSDTIAGAKASAMIYSLMLTCRACSVEPYAHLEHVLTELLQRAPDADVADLLTLRSAKLQRVIPLDAIGVFKWTLPNNHD